jgi:hypothetical protein
MISFARKGTNIEIKVESSINWNWTPVIACHSEPYAILLSQNLRDHLYNELTRIRREAYLEGWNDKQKRKPKTTWWTGLWK